MRGDDRRPEDLFTYSRTEQQVPAARPLRHIREMVATRCGAKVSPEFAPAVCEDGPAGVPAREAASARPGLVTTWRGPAT